MLTPTESGVLTHAAIYDYGAATDVGPDVQDGKPRVASRGVRPLHP